jgi:hypothetical protein
MAKDVTSKKRKTCFVVGPIGDPDSDARIHADWILEEIIQPVLSQFSEYTVIRADQIAPPGMIDAQVIQHLLDSDLVIADLSKENANAFYEIGIRHMAQKPVVHMQLVEEKIPFDVSLYRTLKFSRSRPSDLRKARDELKRTLEAVLAEDYKVDNPVTRARGQIKIEQEATPEQQIVLEQLRAIQARLDNLEDRPQLIRRRSPTKTETITVEVDKTGDDNEIMRLVSQFAMVRGAGLVTRPDSRRAITIDIESASISESDWKKLEKGLYNMEGVQRVDYIPF